MVAEMVSLVEMMDLVAATVAVSSLSCFSFAAAETTITLVAAADANRLGKMPVGIAYS